MNTFIKGEYFDEQKGEKETYAYRNWSFINYHRSWNDCSQREQKDWKDRFLHIHLTKTADLHSDN